MAESEFQAGRLAWSVQSMTPEELRETLLQTPWDDGYLAFSAEERRLGGDGITLLAACLSGRADAAGGPEGYLMEAGLWRQVPDGREEICLEREGDRFRVQRWRLHTAATGGGEACCYRKAWTFSRGNLRGIFGDDIPTLEVVVPQHRLRLYLTEGVAR